MNRSNSPLTCGDHRDGHLAVHGGVYEGSEYDVCVRVHCFVDDFCGRVDLYTQRETAGQSFSTNKSTACSVADSVIRK
jgi:hypothetical protein